MTNYPLCNVDFIITRKFLELFNYNFDDINGNINYILSDTDFDLIEKLGFFIGKSYNDFANGIITCDMNALISHLFYCYDNYLNITSINYIPTYQKFKIVLNYDGFTNRFSKRLSIYCDKDFNIDYIIVSSKEMCVNVQFEYDECMRLTQKTVYRINNMNEAIEHSRYVYEYNEITGELEKSLVISKYIQQSIKKYKNGKLISNIYSHYKKFQHLDFDLYEFNDNIEIRRSYKKTSCEMNYVQYSEHFTLYCDDSYNSFVKFIAKSNNDKFDSEKYFFFRECTVEDDFIYVEDLFYTPSSFRHKHKLIDKKYNITFYNSSIGRDYYKEIFDNNGYLIKYAELYFVYDSSYNIVKIYSVINQDKKLYHDTRINVNESTETKI